MATVSEENKNKRCDVCGADMSTRSADFFICASCRYMFSNLAPGRGAEVEGVASVRLINYKIICDIIKNEYSSNANILDVGCANGLFLSTARDEGFYAVGLEPDLEMAAAARDLGFDVGDGFFPESEWLAGKSFDTIVFNDSFEHIPNPNEIIAGIKRYLNENGIVIVNIPSSSGLIFTLSFLMSKIGITSPLDRLWQKGFASPHLHYFNPENLQLLFENHGFQRIYHTFLKSYTLNGLWKRMRCNTPFLKSIIAWCCLVAFYPFYSLLKSKSDISLSLFKKRAS